MRSGFATTGIAVMICAMFCVQETSTLDCAEFDGLFYSGTQRNAGFEMFSSDLSNLPRTSSQDACTSTFLGMLDISRRQFSSKEITYQSVHMLYDGAWDGLKEGPTWAAWWTQNSYGTQYPVSSDCVSFCGYQM